MYIETQLCNFSRITYSLIPEVATVDCNIPPDPRPFVFTKAVMLPIYQTCFSPPCTLKAVELVAQYKHVFYV